MALTNTKAATGKPASAAAASAKFASLSRSKMVAGGGLPTGFEGTITKARYGVSNFQGKTQNPDGHYVLVGKILIQPDEGSDVPTDSDGAILPVEGMYSMGNKSLLSFVPSNDGTPAGASFDDYANLAVGVSEDGTQFTITSEDEATLEGLYALPTQQALDDAQKKGQLDENGEPSPQLRKGSNWDHFLECLEECWKPQPIPNDGTPNIAELLEGTHGRWDRIPQKSRRPSYAQSDGGYAKEILVLTAVTKTAKKSGATASTVAKLKATTPTAAPKTATKSAPVHVEPEPSTETAVGDDEFNTKLLTIVTEVTAAAGGKIKRMVLPGKMVTAFKGDPEGKDLAIKCVGKNGTWLADMTEAGALLFDAEEDTVALVA
jgi:hypothetical protein